VKLQGASCVALDLWRSDYCEVLRRNTARRIVKLAGRFSTVYSIKNLLRLRIQSDRFARITDHVQKSADGTRAFLLIRNPSDVRKTAPTRIADFGGGGLISKKEQDVVTAPLPEPKPACLAAFGPPTVELEKVFFGILTP
jgi:hypothetical protein